MNPTVDLGEGISDIRAITASGQVVGHRGTDQGRDRRAFSWTRAGGMVDLTLGTQSWARAVSSRGQVVGRSARIDGRIHAFSWTQSGGMVDLGTLGGNESRAIAVSDTGAVFGDTTHLEGWTLAFWWTAEKGMVPGPGGFFGVGALTAGDQPLFLRVGAGGTEPWFWMHPSEMRYPCDLRCAGTLGRLEGASATRPILITPLGQVVGVCPPPANNGFLWTEAGGMVDLGRETWPAAITPDGQIVGRTTTPSGETRAFSWTKAGGIVELGTLGGSYSTARAVSDTGLVVGTSTTVRGEARAFWWTAKQGMADLGPIDHVEDGPFAVNSAGQIVGTSAGHGVLWTVDVPVDVDTSPPVITIPVVANATSPKGAPVFFKATASDDRDASPTLTYKPAPGSTLKIGDTAVTCTASDASGNKSTRTFVVHVNGAAEQLDELRQVLKMAGVPVGAQLDKVLTSAQLRLKSNNMAGAVATLDTFITQVTAAYGKKLIPPTLAQTLIVDATRIEAVLGKIVPITRVAG